MKNPFIFLIALGITFVASCAAPIKNETFKITAPPITTKSLAGQIHAAVNSYRRERGKQQLLRHPGLDQLANNHSEYMRKNRGTFDLYGKNVSHWGFEGRALLARERFNIQNMSENVVAAYHPGKSGVSIIVDLWDRSKAHKINMGSSWTCTGIGTAVDNDGTVFATQIFGTMRSSQMSTRERFNRF